MKKWSEILRTGLIAVLLASSAFLYTGCSESGSAVSAPAGKGKTLFQLQVDKSGALVDETGAVKPVVKGGRVAADERFGRCLIFGSDAGNLIRLADGGKISFDGGFTLEAWVYLEDGDKPNPGGGFVTKNGSLVMSLKDGKLSNNWFSFPKESVFTTTDKQFKYYPLSTEGFGGAITIPGNRWVHLAVSYDQDLKVIRTWIDGGLDRTRYLTIKGEAVLPSNPASPMDLFQGMKNFRVASVKLSRGALRLGQMPMMETYVQQLPWQNRVVVTLDHIDKSIPLPMEVAFTWEYPTGGANVIKRVILDSHDRQDIVLDKLPGWNGSLFTLITRVYAANKEVYSRAERIARVKPAGPVAINGDKSISVNGKKIFPLMIYHAFPEDYKTLADMGFNIITPRGLSLRWLGFGGNDERELADIRFSLDEAQKAGAYLMINANSSSGSLAKSHLFKKHPALISWYGYDEPWGTFDKVRESYNMVKMLDPDYPIFSAQNNPTRFAETAEGADIIACDPYPLPNVSLRAVYDTTLEVVEAVSGLKPVWTVLDQYGDKLPNLQELRCMSYLAVTAGANGIGIYAWDDRPKKTDGWYTGAYPQHVEVLRQGIKELKGLENILLIPNSSRKTIFSPGNRALHAAIKEDAGKKYLFIVSDSRRAEEGVLEIEGIGDAAGICLEDGQKRQNISIRNGKVTLKLPPLAAAVYEIR